MLLLVKLKDLLKSPMYETNENEMKLFSFIAIVALFTATSALAGHTVYKTGGTYRDSGLVSCPACRNHRDRRQTENRSVPRTHGLLPPRPRPAV